MPMIERQKREKIMRSKTSRQPSFDDMARMAGEALRLFGGARGRLKSMVERLLDGMDLVTREEFERVEAIALRARERQAELEKRLAALEKKKTATAPAPKRGKKRA